MKETLKKLLDKYNFVNGKIKDGDIHIHMESHLDSGSTIDDFLKRYSQLEAKAVVITDHGVMTAYPDVYAKAQDYGIKVIPGCEVYLKDELGKRIHLILIAPNLQKYRDLCKICTEAYKDTEKIGKVVIPYVSMDVLKKYGKGMIATSACMQGPLALVYRQNDNIDSKIKKLAAKCTSDPRDSKYSKMLNQSVYLEKELDSIRKKKTELQKAKADEAEVQNLTAKIVQIKADLSKIKDSIKKIDAKAEVYEECKAQIKDLEAQKLKENAIDDAILAKFKEFEDIFGENNFFIELQNHRIPLETEIMKKLAQIAKANNLPVVATNDTHMALKTDSLKRQILRSDRFESWTDLADGDEELYIKTSMELAEMISEIADEDTVLKALLNIGYIINKCEVVLSNENHYPKYQTPNEESSEEYLRKLVYENVKKRFKEGEFTKVYRDRLEYELKIISDMGYADYHLIEQDFTSFGRKLSHMPESRLLYLKEHMKEISLEEMLDYIDADQSEIGYYIGPGRGSAAGSLVCFTLGITNIDPIKNNLVFERFLNPERVTMPDIDTDVETFCRPVLIEYIKKKYGEDAVCCIMTKGYAGGKEAIRTYARVKESIAKDKSYYRVADSICKAYPVNKSLDECSSDLMEQFAEDTKALEIIENAKLIEGQFTNYSKHAAGVIIADRHPVSDYVALMWEDKNKVWKTQCDMTYAELMGLLKFDLLGLRTLSVITETVRRIKKRYGIEIDIEKIPQEREVYKNIYASGNTDAVFQVESDGMKNTLKKLNPTCFEDLILAIAAYRPGPMDFIPDIIRSKNFGEKPDYAIKEMGEILDVTYGYPIYQEQLMELFHRFAGFSLGKADIVRRYMSKKKEEKFMEFRPDFIEGFVSNGASPKKATVLWESLVDFSKYAFNKSHATAYAVVSYQTAWLKYHYPAEFITSVLNSFDNKKLVSRAPRLINSLPGGAKIISPNINKSEKTFEMDENGNIMFGLSNIKGAGNPTEFAVQNRPYKSFADYMMRGHSNKKTTQVLIKAGAFDTFCQNRNALLIAYDSYSEMLSNIEILEKKVLELNQKITILKTSQSPLEDLKAEGYVYKKVPKINTIEGYLAKAEEDVKAAKQKLSNIIIPIDTEEDKREKLEIEKELLGLYISASPLDDYLGPQELGCCNISDVEAGTQSIMGIISSLRVVNRKSDGKPLAFFTLEDKTGQINVNCFTKEYVLFKDELTEGNIVIINGNIEEEITEFTDEETGIIEEEKSYKITLKALSALSPNRPPIILHVKNLFEWNEQQDEVIKLYGKKDGHPLVIDNTLEDNFRKTDIYVSSAILDSEKFQTKLTE